MIIEGSKIELVKEMGPFTNIGEVCEVVKIAEDGVISFKFGNGLHLGYMSYAEYETYFKPYEEPEKVIREWSNWSRKEVSYFNDIEGFGSCPIEYRDNGKKIQVRCLNDYYGIKAASTCCPTDKFDFEKGYNLAIARLRVKMVYYDSIRLAASM